MWIERCCDFFLKTKSWAFSPHGKKMCQGSDFAWYKRGANGQFGAKFEAAKKLKKAIPFLCYVL
jgi:hypothetical protein